ncbi:alkaline phosphatase family protein [Desertivirga brevis]|uniref:alkaline phosphatase family protein n=1 Tax=Desertivirga brevis TaxID=2810310 RepID=UPI001A97CBF4|nr:alkaline phosphatase family protein [Pedobacter sp. SYSU D00873]
MRAGFLRIITLLFILPGLSTVGQSRTENVVLITLDGMRWQEIFQGADKDILYRKKGVENVAEIESQFWDKDPLKRREKLLPFIWSEIATNGQIYGNRSLGNKVNVRNKFRFSYPGYNELLTGFPDKRINSNAKRNNPNQTVLEFLNKKIEYKDKVAAFASWDVFHYILNQQRSGVHVNAGNDTLKAQKLSARERFLNQLHKASPSPWSGTRFDKITHQYASEYFKNNKPKFLLIAYGETDEYAHHGNYSSYLKSANKTDAYIQEVWNWIQSDEQYRDKTTLVITTDHGRGNGRRSWRSHGVLQKGSNNTWFMIMGPDTQPLGEMKEKEHYYNNQLAKTIAGFLNLEYPVQGAYGEVIATAMEH